MTMEVKKSTGGRANGKKRKRLKNSFTRPKAISKLIVIILAALSVAAAILYLFLGKRAYGLYVRRGKHPHGRAVADGYVH